MNKIFKVVWSKTKECYVVVSEVAKNNSGKKKVLASVLATLAIMGAGAQMGTPVHADTDLRYSAVNIAPNNVPAGYGPNKVSTNSIVVGYANDTKTGAQGNGHVAYGFGNTATEDTTTALGGGNKATGPAATAIGSFNEATARASVAMGNVAKASGEKSISIGNYSVAKSNDDIAIGNQAKTTSTGDSIAMGRQATAGNANALAFGAESNASGWGSIATGREAAASANFATAIGYQSKAEGSASVAIGKQNKSNMADTITMGNGNTANTMGGIAIGLNNKADSSIGDSTTANKSNLQIAFGRDNEATSLDTIAIGREVKSTKTGAVAMGSRINANGDYAVAIGNSSAGGTVEAGDYAVAVGFKAKATGGRSIAQGGAAEAAARASIAMGLRSKVNAQKATSNYEFSGSNGTPSPAGYNTETITINSASAPAGGAVAGNYYDAGSAIAVGEGATVSDESDRAVVVGPDAKTNGNAHYSVVLGSGSHADASDGFVAGHGSSVASRESIAIGSGANVSGTENIRSQAIGFGATVTGTGAYDATAIGATAQVSGVQGGVALGSGSLLSRTTNSNENAGFNSKFVDGTKVRNRAYTADLTGHNDQWDSGSINTGAVSVGNDTQKRQIINVAAGNKDTDAVNVAQLKNVGVRVGADTNTATITVGTNTSKVAADFLAYNGQLNIKGDNNRVTTVSENDANGKDANVNVKFDYDGLVKAKTGSAVTVDQKTDAAGKTYFEIDAAAASKTVLADGKNTTVTGAGTTASPYKVNVEGALTGISSITNNTGGKIEFTTSGTTISGGPVNVSNNKITGVADGDVSSTSKDAVNGSQLHAVKTAERHIAPTTAGTEYTVDSNGDVTMTYLDGNNDAVANEKAVIKGIAKNDLSNITNEGKKEITKLGTIVKAGDNVNVSESSDATTGRTTYTVSAVTPAVYTKADGTKVYKRPDGTFTTNSNLAAGNNVDKGDVITSFMDGNGNTTGGNMVINNVGSAIKNAGNAGDSFLTKLDAANTATPNAAVNVSDLKNTADGLTDKGLKFNANEGGVKTNKLGSKVTVQGTGSLTAGKAYADEYNTANIRTKIDQDSDGNTTINVGLAKALKDINSISNGNSSITFNSNPGGTNNTPAVQITGGNLSMGNGTTNNKIVNLAPGTNDTDAVNYSQIKGLRTEVKQGANVTVSKTQGTDGHDIYTISAAATGGTASSWNIKSSADTANGGATATGHNANAVNISDQKTVEMVAGKNLTVKQDTTTDGAKVELALSDNIVAGKDGVNGKDGSVGATGKDGSSVVINGADGSIGMTGPKGQDGKDGINGRDGANISMTSAKGEQVLVNRDPAHNADTDKAERIVYVPKDANGDPIKGADGKNIVREVATMDDGLKFAGDDAQGTDKSKVIAKKLNNTVDIIGGANSANLTDNNIGVNNDNGKLKVQLAKTIDLTKDGSVTTGNTKVDNSGVTITAPTGGATTNVTLTQSGLDNGGNKIVNVKAGDVNATSTDAVNGSQLYAVKAAERHIKPTTNGSEYTVDSNGDVTMTYLDGNNDAVANEKAVIKGIAKNDLSNITNEGKKEITKLGTIVKAGDNVNVSESSDATTGRTTYTVNAVTPAVYTTPDGEKLTKKSDGKFYKADGSEYTGGDIITSFENPNANSIPAGKNSTTDGGMIVNNIGSAIKNQTPTMPAGQTATYLDKLKAAADAGSNVKNAAVNVSDLHNTAEALRANELHIAPTAVKSGSTEVKGGELNTAGTENVYKYDAATKKVTLTYNDGNGKAVTDTKAVIDFSALNTGGTTASTWTAKTSAENTTAGSEVGKHAGNDSQVIGNQNSVDFQAGRNMTVKQTNDGNGNTTINYALDKDLTNLDKVVVNGKDGIAGKDGVTIVGPQGATGAPGIPGTNGIDGKVGISGKDGKDAVSIAGKDGVGTIGLTGPQGPAGTNGKSVDISTENGKQTLVKPEKNNGDQSQRIVYVPKDKDGNPLLDKDNNPIKREVATMDDGLKFAGDDAQGTDKSKVIAKQLNNTVDIIGGANSANLTDNNIGVNNDNGKLKVQLAKTIDLTKDGSVTTGNTKVDNSGVTITAPTGGTTTNVTLTQSGLNNGGNKITNVKAGTDDTDAVNVKQLKENRTEVKAGDNVVVTSAVDATDNHTVYTVNAVTPAVYTTPDGTKLTKDKDGKFHKEGETAEYTGDIITSFENPKAATGQTTKDGGMIVNNIGSAIKNQNPTMPAGQTATYLDKLKAAADAGSNVKNAAVNVSDLHNTAEALKASELHIAPTVGGNDADKGGVGVTPSATATAAGAATQAYKYNTNTKQVELTFNDGNGKAVTGPKAVIDLSDLANQITSGYTFSANATANGGTVANDAATPAVVTAVENGGTINYAAGKNLTVKQDIDTATKTHTYTYALADKIGIGEKGQPGVPGKDGVDGKIGVNGKDGSSVVINGADGSIGMTGPKGQDGKDGINGRNGADISITSAKGEQVLINRDPAHNGDADKAERIVYVPKDASGNPIKGADNKNIVREVATMDDGLKFGGDMGTVGAVKLNKQVDVKGGITDTNKLATGNNIGVTSVPDATTGNTALNIQLAKDLTGLNSVELGGKTIKTDGDHITITTPSTTPGGNATVNKVANLSDELHITPGTYEVGAVDKDANAKNDEVTLTYTDGNGAEKANTFAKIKGVANSDLSNISNDGKKNITKLGSIVKAGDNVTVSEKSDATTGQKTYTVNAVTPAVYTKADGTKVYKIVDPTTGAVTWNTSADGNGTPVNANEVIASFETPANGTTPGATTGGTMIVNNIGSAISGHEAKDTAGTVITSPTYLQRLETAAGDNLTKHAAVNVSDLNSAAKELKASELHIAPTAVKSGSTEVKGGVASGTENVYKYDATTKKVTLTYNDGNGKAVTDTKAVIDFSDLAIPAGGNNYGFKANVTANGGKVANDATTPAAATAVESGGTVNFAAGKNLTVKQDIDATNKTQTYTFSLDKDLTNLDKVVVNGKDGQPGKDGVTIVGPQGATGAPGMPGTNGIDGKVGISGKDGKDAVSIAGKDGVGTIGLTGPQGPAGTNGKSVDISTENGKQTLVKPEKNNGDQSQRIVYVPKDKDGNPLLDKDNNPIKREVATMDDGLRFTGNNTSKENKQPMNSLVKVQGEGVTENTTSGKLEVNGQEFKSATGNIAVVADGDKTLTVKMNKDLNLTKDGSVTMGDTVVNNGGITIKAPTTPGTTTTDVKLTNQGLDNGGNKITNVKAGTDDTDAVNVKQLKDKVTTVTSSDSSIKVVDKNVAGQPGYDATKGHQYDITINNQGVVNNAQTPVVYTTEDGTKVYKQPDGTFTTNINGTGTVVPANQVIASMNSAGNSSTDPTKLQNVGSSIADKTGTTFLDKINTAAADPNAKYGAVNVTDLKSTADAIGEKGLNFGTQSTGTNSEIHKNLGEKLEIVGGGTKADGEYDASNIKTMTKDGKVVIALDKNIKADSVTVGEKGQPGAPGKDGKIGVNGADGSAVVINGKDGSIGLNGKDGANGITIKGDKGVDGVDGLNGTNGITRIVYQDKDGNKHEVATHDDGMKFAGDDGQTNQDTNPQVIKKHLNKVVDIIGGADKTKLTDNNIGVNNDGGKLKVQLANELGGINTISNGGSSITFNSNPGGATNTPAVKISGGDLNMGGNKITNVKNGTAPTDAATVGQLTKVEAGDNSVTVAHTTTADGQNVYTIKANPAGTVDLTNVNNRIDQLGEEVGRVGAQGAALSALKPIQYDPLEPTQIMAGYGNYRGNSAVALGVAHYKNESTLIHGGVSWAGGSSHMMANAGVTWKVGNRDSEAAVADRYRKGPISSAYAMQQEMAAMKAQNAGLKGEVSDLKAENEQMKAQIAAMMAKLGL